ncbi:MAG: flagellar hook-length control protein FliK [Thiobacillaceae bacterium]
MPALLIDSHAITPSTANGSVPNPNTPQGGENSAVNSQSFQSALDKELRQHLGDSKDDIKGDTKPAKKDEAAVAPSAVPDASNSPANAMFPGMVPLQASVNAIANSSQTDGSKAATPPLTDPSRNSPGITKLGPGLVDSTAPANSGTQVATSAQSTEGDVGSPPADTLSTRLPGFSASTQLPSTLSTNLPAAKVSTTLPSARGAGLSSNPAVNVPGVNVMPSDQSSPIKPITAQDAIAAIVLAKDQSLQQGAPGNDPPSLSAVNINALPGPALSTASTPHDSPQTRIDAPVGSDAWNDALGRQVVLMAADKQQQAEIHLSPPDMGPIKVTVTLDNNQATVSFVVRDGATGNAIQSALPRLTEMMAESGISLGQTNVQADASGSFSQPDRSSRAPEPIARQSGNSVMPPSVQTTISAIAPDGLVDRFA